MAYRELWPGRRDPFAKIHKLPAYDNGVVAAIARAYVGGLITRLERNIFLLEAAGILVEDEPAYGGTQVLYQK